MQIKSGKIQQISIDFTSLTISLRFLNLFEEAFCDTHNCNNELRIFGGKNEKVYDFSNLRNGIFYRCRKYYRENKS